MRWALVLGGWLMASVCGAGAIGQVTTTALLREMTDPSNLARWPSPEYTCRQFSSYDRASTSPDDGESWFANSDAGHFLRVETIGEGERAKKAWVLADMEGPGAVVRIWSANPPKDATLRVYVDDAAEDAGGGGAAGGGAGGWGQPVIEAPMGDLLSGKWAVGEPLSHTASRGWNLYMPIPYARRCKITCDAGGFYYQVNYRTYEPGTSVTSVKRGEWESLKDTIARANTTIAAAPVIPPAPPTPTLPITLEPGQECRIGAETGGGAITEFTVRIAADDLEAASRSTVVIGTFDGEQTIWCPVGDFFGSGVGANAFHDLYRAVAADGSFVCRWVMPYQHIAELKLRNLGSKPVSAYLDFKHDVWNWDDRSMHFHATWRNEYPIHTRAGHGTEDWNYVSVDGGRGVYVGDNLAVMNPVGDWWGEGDEKIYVDGERFPSHFGTGTEDYYGYAWCYPQPFMNPFHAQPRCDGWNGGRRPSNWGHTTVTRVRALDAIPFTKSLRFDMEVWHWAECDVGYAATAYFYARPGAEVNRKPDEASARSPVPQPPARARPMTMAGAIECESLHVVAKSEGVEVGSQDMEGFAKDTWSDGGHLWVRARKVGDFVEFEVPVPAGLAGAKSVAVTLHATRSWDYGIIQFSLNGKPAGEPVDLFSGGRGKVFPSGPIKLGQTTPREGVIRVRAEVVGGNEKADLPRAFFGLDCFMVDAK